MMYNTLPYLTSIIIGIAEAAVMLAIGLRVFYKMQDEFILIYRSVVWNSEF